jgi:hypothetical protein
VRELLNEYYHTAVFEIKNADSGLSAFAFDWATTSTYRA